MLPISITSAINTNHLDIKERVIQNLKAGNQIITCLCKFENGKWFIYGFDNNSEIEYENDVFQNFKNKNNKYKIKEINEKIKYTKKENIDSNPVTFVYGPGLGGYWITKYDILYSNINTGILLFNENITFFKKLDWSPSSRESYKIDTWYYILNHLEYDYIGNIFSGYMCIIYKNK